MCERIHMFGSSTFCYLIPAALLCQLSKNWVKFPVPASPPPPPTITSPHALISPLPAHLPCPFSQTPHFLLTSSLPSSASVSSFIHYPSSSPFPAPTPICTPPRLLQLSSGSVSRCIPRGEPRAVSRAICTFPQRMRALSRCLVSPVGLTLSCRP